MGVSNAEIDHNYIVGGGYAIANFNSPSDVHHGILVHHNVVVNTGNPTLFGHFGSGMQNCKFYNNTVHSPSTGYQFFWFEGDTTGTEMKNNVFVGSGSNAFANFSNPGNNHLTVDTNLFYNASSYGTNAMTSNPGLTLSGSDPDPYYAPGTGAYVIDKGVTISGITDGYQGSAPDLGAIEAGLPFKAGVNAVPVP